MDLRDTRRKNHSTATGWMWTESGEGQLAQGRFQLEVC